MVMLSLVTGQFFSSGLIIFGEMAMVAMALTIGRDLSVDTDTKTVKNNQQHNQSNVHSDKTLHRATSMLGNVVRCNGAVPVEKRPVHAEGPDDQI